MLLLHDENTHGWRLLMLELLPSGIDTKPSETNPNDTEGPVDEVRDVIRSALAWAAETKFSPAPKHALKKYVEQYWRTRDRRQGPIIPTFLRVYCADRLGRRFCDQVIARHRHRHPERDVRGGRPASKQSVQAQPRLTRVYLPV